MFFKKITGKIVDCAECQEIEDADIFDSLSKYEDIDTINAENLLYHNHLNLLHDYSKCYRYNDMVIEYFLYGKMEKLDIPTMYSYRFLSIGDEVCLKHYLFSKKTLVVDSV